MLGKHPRTMNDPSATGRSTPSGPALTERHREALDRFIRFWGDMASSWGINRTMAQIHALLYAVEEPLDTDVIMARLGISRGSANMNLRSLVSWNLVRKVRQAGSRKDWYAAEKDVWEITLRIVRERERREIKPVVQELNECRDLLTGGGMAPCPETEDPGERRFCERIDNLIKLMLVFEGLSRTLLPFIQEGNADLLKQLVTLAEPMREGDHG